MQGAVMREGAPRMAPRRSGARRHGVEPAVDEHVAALLVGAGIRVVHADPLLHVDGEQAERGGPGAGMPPELAAARPIVKAFYLGTMDTEQKIEKVVKHRRSTKSELLLWNRG